jgi:DNA polymerase-3 subunit alpha
MGQVNRVNWTPLHVHTMYSCLDGFGTPEENVMRAKELGMTSLGISDHGNVCGVIDHIEKCTKNDIKPIIGEEFYLSHAPIDARSRWVTHMVVIAKNKQGWTDLRNASSASHTKECFYYKPRLSMFGDTNSLENFAKNGNLISISGHQGSHLSDNLFCNLFGMEEIQKPKLKDAYRTKFTKMSDLETLLKPDWFESTCELALRLEKVFDKGNFYIELQDCLNPNDKLALWIQPLIVKCLRKVAKETNIPAVASSDPHYPRKENAPDQRILIMTNLKMTEKQVQAQFDSEDIDMFTFFGTDEFYIKSYEEMLEKFTKEELEESNKIASKIETFDIKHKPVMPSIVIPAYKPWSPEVARGTTDSEKFMLHLCYKGMDMLKPYDQTKIPMEKYKERLDEEIKVIVEAGLCNYFIAMWDIVCAAKFRPKDGSFDWITNLKKRGQVKAIAKGKARGSAAGCLISYLMGITLIDPLLYNLSFARFYSKGRNTKDNVSLPDIDLDFAVDEREWIISYIKWRYGEASVAQIATFGRMQGRAAIKDVCRIKSIDQETAESICQYIPDEAAIADELQEERDAGDLEYGIIDWSLDNEKDLKKMCDDSRIDAVVKQAIRCEGRIRSIGRHASGIVAMPGNVSDYFPMIYDTKMKAQVIGVDMRNVEKLGGVKMDILGTAILDRIMMAQELING